MEPTGIVVVQGITKMTPEVHRAIQSESQDFDVIRNAEIVIGMHGEKVAVLKHPALGADGDVVPIPHVDLRTRVEQYRDGEELRFTMGLEARDWDVRTESGIPIRGISRVTVEDDVAQGRAVMVRFPGASVAFPGALADV